MFFYKLLLIEADNFKNNKSCHKDINLFDSSFKFPLFKTYSQSLSILSSSALEPL